MSRANMLQGKLELPLQFLSLFPYPLHLVIEGSTGSGKTWLAQHLAKKFAIHTEIWSSFSSETYSVIPDAPVYKPDYHLCGDKVPSIWQEQASFWSGNASNKSRCILIDEVPCLLRLDPDDLLLNFLGSVEDTNIIITTQDFEVERGLVEHSLESCFSLIRLGKNARRYAKYVLKNAMLVQQLEATRYPCLFQGEVIDLAEFKVVN